MSLPPFSTSCAALLRDVLFVNDFVANYMSAGKVSRAVNLKWKIQTFNMPTGRDPRSPT